MAKVIAHENAARKLNPTMKEIQREIRKKMKSKPRMPMWRLHELVTELLGKDAPRFSTMVQNLSYWSKYYRNPGKEKLEAYYYLVTGKKLHPERAKEALKQPPRKGFYIP